MTLSAIMDAFEELGTLSLVPEITAPVFSRLVAMGRQELQGGSPSGFSALVSEGLDLARSVYSQAPQLLKKKQPIPEYLGEALQDFLKRCGDPPREAAPAESEPAIAAQTAAIPALDREEKREVHQRQIMLTFLQDAHERLDLAQARVLDLETSADSAGLLNELFRVFHTFKGETGFLHLPRLGEIAHHFESVLDHLRNHRIRLDTVLIDLLLEGIDAARSMLRSLAENGQECAGDGSACAELIGRITAILHQQNEPIGSQLARSGLLDPAQVQHVLEIQKQSGYLRKFGEIVVSDGLAKPDEIEAVLSQQRASEKPGAAAGTGAGLGEAPANVDPADSLIKVRSNQVQFLVDMLGELVISLNQLDDDDRRVQSSRKIAKNLQLSAMQIGTVRIGTLFSNLRRIVRETCRQVGREADLLVSGDDLEVDRKLVDKLSEPLMHLLRNAIGHGIESAAERQAAGKPARGVIQLVAERRGHHVIIRVRDDGRGMAIDRILAKAVEKELVSREKAASMSPAEILELIFLPGFSTADTVDAVSGRGVGMDVVKNMVELMRGKISLETKPGSFSEITLTFPINMAIIDGMIVTLGGRLFIIPVSAIVESLELVDTTFLAVSDGVRVCSLRGETMPVIDLGDWFGLKRPDECQRQMAVVVEARGGKYMLVVHEIVAKREVVIKSLGRLFAQTRGISSGTILQGGRIGLVLDIDQIVRTD